jgi:hypothetical protein
VNAEGWAAIVAAIEAATPGPWACPEGDGGRVVVRGIENEVGGVVEWHLKCPTCGTETYARRGPSNRG